ncbi:MAG: hypothetical protein CME71_02140 [Halobacteriovorax sp.]|nr:hypothetical protein [Halobacteriovorax sp.]|tara:strand:+ start:581 stop:829 length:249 start_codon:yes stop_codon:yes gene_type:complete
MTDYKIIEARHTNDTKFYVRFNDGLEGELDYKDFNTLGLGADLLEPTYLSKIFIDDNFGNVAWPNGVDICKDYLHQILSKST